MLLLVDERCAQLMDEARKKADELQREMRVQLIMLPEPVRRMPWRVFVDQYGGDIERAMGLAPDDTESGRSATPVTATLEPEEPASTVSRAPPPTVRSKDRGASPMGRPPLTPYVPRGAAASVFETPAASSDRIPSVRPGLHGIILNVLDLNVLCTERQTVMRTVRKGETLYSIRGSPVVPDAATFAPLAPTPAPAAPFVTLENASETIAALGTTSVRLDEEARAQAKAQLKLLQEQVNALMRQLA